MSVVTIDPATGCLVIRGAKLFVIGLSEAPAPDGQTRDGHNAWAEIAGAGVNLVRSGLHDWSLAQIDAQIAAERARMDAAAAHQMYCWPRLGNAGNLPTTPGSVAEQLLVKIAGGLKTHAALAAYKGVDERDGQGRAGRHRVVRPRGRDRRERGDPERPADLLRGVDEAGGEPLL